MFTKIIDWIKLHLVRNINKYIFLFLCVSLISGGVLVYFGKMTQLSDQIRYFGFSLTIFSVLLAMLQFRSTQNWNKRQLALQVCKNTKEDTNEHVKVLSKAFDYLQLRTRDVISVDNIHDKMCMQKDGKLMIDVHGEGYKIKRAIHNILNAYEYIAVGVYQNVLDEKVIEALKIGEFIRVYNNFSAYIEHMNDDMYPDRNGRIWINFVTLSKKFDEEEKKKRLATHDKRKEADL